MMAVQPEDLAPLEQVVLGVLSLGLPPSRAAGDDRFRVDYVCAVTHGLRSAGHAHAYLDAASGRATREFREQLEEAVRALTEKGLVAQQPAGLPAAAGSIDAALAVDMVDPDIHPAVLDRYLGQQCMELLLRPPDVYPFLMERYAKAGEVWRRIRERLSPNW